MKTVEVDVEILAITPNAVFVDDGDLTVWVPWSLIDGDEDDFMVGETTTIEIPEWFAEKEGLI